MKLFISVFLVLTLSIVVYAQTDEDSTDRISVNMSEFLNSSRHWYGIRDEGNIINPLPDQQRYDETEITRIADNMLLYQRSNGGWPKNYDMRAILTEEQIEHLLETKDELQTTFDNATTYTQIQYLAKVYSETQIEKYKDGCLKGLEFMLDAQYENGGWPQYYPLKENYSRHITFNDGAYMGIMKTLRMIIQEDPSFSFLDDDIRLRIETAYEKGLECILNSQIVDQRRLTAWCQQYDANTLQPAWARAYEPPSICNGESASIVQFLMDIEEPDQRVVQAVQSAVKWFADSRIYNTRVETFEAKPLETQYKTITKDRRVVHDPEAPPVWTRYYELGTGKPLFSDRDSQLLYSMAEVSRERRLGYAWYIYSPQTVLDAYPDWLQKNGLTENVLNQ
ncbi:pectate lyase [uncultured Sunxiuqinia sp.]|uniref:pectate lyase n=1 Tax=uncultured Sunxiuqinia sp. TaxID=1573825 RepID=UPI0030DCECA8|tara:strand:+ start:6329 stop:7510 length:1182 start_codon:yes stop_codon:yes gene_type:complete